MKISIALVLVVLMLTAPNDLAQIRRAESGQSRNESWQTYLPPDNSFRIDSPIPLRRIDCFESAEDSNAESDEEARGIVFYGAEQTSPTTRSFGVVVIDGTHPEIRAKSAEERVGGLWFLIGGDDTEPTVETVVRANGLTGTEYAYLTTSRNGFYARGRVFDTGEYIYVVVFASESTENLISPDAERFFNSFYPGGGR